MRSLWRKKINVKIDGFTLVELITVVSIMAVMIGLLIPSFNSMRNGSDLTQAGQLLVGQIDVAHQTAAAHSHAMEIRVYSYKNPQIPNADDNYCGIQIFEIMPDGTKTAIDKALQIPVSTKICPSETLSTLITSSYALSAGDIQKNPLPSVGVNYTGFAFRIRPNGSTDLPNPIISSPPSNFFITIHGLNAGHAETQPPANYYTIQIDPLNSSIRTYRP